MFTLHSSLFVLQKTMKSVFLSFLWLLHSCHGDGAGYMLRQDLPPESYPLAVCNDGTQANCFHQPGEHKGKIKINLEGGGKCESIAACQNRCKNTEFHCIAQTEWDREVDERAAMFSAHWNVFVHYCSSDLWPAPGGLRRKREASTYMGRISLKL